MHALRVIWKRTRTRADHFVLRHSGVGQPLHATTVHNAAVALVRRLMRYLLLHFQPTTSEATHGVGVKVACGTVRDLETMHD